jgi:ABC-type branched-subunit amino acid transport system substrate-binding protein
MRKTIRSNHMRFQPFFLCVVMLLPCLASPSWMSDDPQAVYKRAVEQYRAFHYDSSAATVRTFLKTHGNDTAAEYLVPLLVESSLRLNDFALTRRLFQIYMKKFPLSVFIPRLWYDEGVSLVNERDNSGALAAFSHSLSGGVNQSLDSLIVGAVQKISDKALTADEIDLLSVQGDLHPRIVEVMQYYELCKLYESGQIMRARQKSELFLKRYQHSPFTSSVKDLNSKINESQKGLVQIGLLAPLSGYDADIGRQVLQGAQLAFDQYTAANGAKLRLIICDTRGSGIETAKKTRELVQENHVPIILGPVLSQDAIVAASILMDKDVVMLSPTANDEGIAALGPNIFQMNVTLGTLGAKIARYAMDNCNIHDFAIISPSSEYASALSSGFRQEVEKSGREIVDEQTYEEGTRDFKLQYERLEARLLQRKQQRTAVEKSLSGDMPPPAQKSETKPPSDTTHEVGGLFIPAEAEDVVMLAPQATFHRLKTQLLGSIGWQNSRTIIDGKEYVSGALFSTNLPVSTAGDKEWLDFKALYRSRWGADPDRPAALGYDAASLIIRCLRDIGGSGSPTSDQISQALAKIKGYKGASGLISFDPSQRKNTEASIIKIKDKQFIRVQ